MSPCRSVPSVISVSLERGLIAAGASPSVEEINALIFEPGFSTAEKVTEISGRGVGMDVVRRNIDALRGRIEIATEAGKGTTFLIRLPLTLAVLDGLTSAGEPCLVKPFEIASFSDTVARLLGEAASGGSLGLAASTLGAAQAQSLREYTPGASHPMTCFGARHAMLIALSVMLAPLALRGQGTNPTPPSVPLGANALFTVAMNTATLEGGPVYVADNGPRGIGFQVINGGVRNLANGGAHAATNAETQFLIAGAPNVRILFTVAEGLYRIVARRSAGISTLADLKGKRIALPRDTSAHYYVVRMLASAGLAESAVKIVDVPRDQMAAGVIDGRADAISMWEPEAQKTVDGLGRDAVVFQDNRVYRELFSLYTTTEVLGDSRRRRELVDFVRALLTAADEMKTKPAPHFPLIAKTTGHSVDHVARSWEHHAFPVAVPGDMHDVMVEEEKWVAGKQNRAPRSRAALAAFFEPAILQEVRRR